MTLNKSAETLIRKRAAKETGQEWVVPVSASLQMLYQHPDCPPLLRDPLGKWLSWPKREEYSVERIVLSPDLAPIGVAALLAMGTSVEFEGKKGARSTLGEYLQRSDPKRGKLSTLCIPAGGEARVWGQAHVRRSPTQKPIVSAIAVLDLEKGLIANARLALAGVWREHARLAVAADALVGATLEPASFERLIPLLQEELSPPDDPYGSAEYRRRMAAVVTQRALQACLNGVERP